MTVFTSYDTLAISSGRTPHTWTHLASGAWTRCPIASMAFALPDPGPSPIGWGLLGLLFPVVASRHELVHDLLASWRGESRETPEPPQRDADTAAFTVGAGAG